MLVPICLGRPYPFVSGARTRLSRTPVPICLGRPYPFVSDARTRLSRTPVPICLGRPYPLVSDARTHLSRTPVPICLGRPFPYLYARALVGHFIVTRTVLSHTVYYALCTPLFANIVERAYNVNSFTVCTIYHGCACCMMCDPLISSCVMCEIFCFY